MKRIFVPTQGLDDWKRLLAAREKHWKDGRSAKSIAIAWETTPNPHGFPSEVYEILAARFGDLEALLAIPELQVPLPGGSRPSQTDLWVLARAKDGLVSIGVEGKVDETFGPTIDEWKQSPSDGRRERLAFLLRTLELTDVPGTIRYQLLHRAASALIQAQRFFAKDAVLLVQSFDPGNAGFADFAAFGALLGTRPMQGASADAGLRSGIRFSVAWTVSPVPQPIP